MPVPRCLSTACSPTKEQSDGSAIFQYGGDRTAEYRDEDWLLRRGPAVRSHSVTKRAHVDGLQRVSHRRAQDGELAV